MARPDPALKAPTKASLPRDLIATTELRDAVTAWHAWLALERRFSPHSCGAYGRDLGAFINFLSEHRGEITGLPQLAALTPPDFRAWLASRVATGLSPSSTNRALSVVRGFFRWLAKTGQVENAALAAIRGPRKDQSLPKALTVPEASAAVAMTAELARESWIGKRDTAVLLLLYGAGPADR